jgi:hypothetical protein
MTIRQLAKRTGVTLEFGDVHGVDVTADAPTGQVFRSNGLHCYVSNSFDNRDRAVVYADIEAAIRYGFEPCTAADCDTCERWTS